jgi:hypothetical protein
MKDLLITIYGGGEEAVEAASRLMPQWIPVSERLPDRYTRVLAFVDCQPHEHSHAIGFIGSLGVWSLDELHEPSAEITHWMPLPEPPAT